MAQIAMGRDRVGRGRWRPVVDSDKLDLNGDGNVDDEDLRIAREQLGQTCGAEPPEPDPPRNGGGGGWRNPPRWKLPGWFGGFFR